VEPSLLTTGPWNRRAAVVGLVGSSALVLLALLTPSGSPLALVAPTGVQLGFALAAVALQLLRRRLPLAVFVALIALAAVSVPLGGYSPSLTVAVGVANYSCAIAYDRRPALILSIAAAVIMLAVLLWAGNEFPGNVLAIVVGGAVGDAVKSHRRAMAEAMSRAEHAEATREAEAQRRVAEDRLSIARDLHDVVAHQIAVINLHAGLASATGERDPGAAKASLGIIRGAAQSALAEIGGLLATLRDPDSATTSAPRLDQLGELLRQARTRGLNTTLSVSGEEQELPYATDVTAFRVIQEALTNAHKHGSGVAEVRLDYSPGEVRLLVSNPVGQGGSGAAAPPGEGRGLVGMRERVTSVKGSLEAGPRGEGAWEVAATLPVALRQQEEGKA
jgi:signal transduction histidine kinase